MGTNTGTVMTLANSIIGVGVLAMPFCFKQVSVFGPEEEYEFSLACIFHEFKSCLCLWHFVLQCGIILSILMLLLSSFLSRLACHFLLKAAIMARRRNFEFLGKFTAVVIYRTTTFKLLPKPVCQFVTMLILNMWSSVSCRHISDLLIWKFVK